MIYTAGFGPAGANDPYRYTLSRDWTDEPELFPTSPTIRLAGLRALFLMMNPSTADGLQNDPTVAKCIRISRRMDYALGWRNYCPDWRNKCPNFAH
jgi:hypothetical protein